VGYHALYLSINKINIYGYNRRYAKLWGLLQS